MECLIGILCTYPIVYIILRIWYKLQPPQEYEKYILRICLLLAPVSIFILVWASCVCILGYIYDNYSDYSDKFFKKIGL